MNLYNLGLSGINAANARLNTTAHNINNMDTAGFNRQTVTVSTAGGTLTGSGYFGRGVSVDGVSRQYSSFLYTQLVSARSQQASLATYSSQISQINDLLGTSSEGVSYALEQFFSSVQAVATQPSDTAARQEMLGQAASLATQINEAQRMLDEQYASVNAQVSTQVDQINSYVTRIDNLNQQITSALAASGSQQPNDLLDQRDQLVSELSQLIGVTTSANGASINLTTGGGQVLLSGTTVYPLKAVASAEDPTRTVVAYTMPLTTTDADGVKTSSTVTVEFDESKLTGGSLGGLLEFRSETLDPIRNDLGRLATGLALSFNELNAQGLTLTDEAGGDIFSIGEPTVYSNANNEGSGQVSAVFSDVDGLASSDYSIVYKEDSGYTITRLSDGTSTTYDADAGVIELDGLSITLPDATDGSVADGDKWSLQPTRTIASTLSVSLTDPSGIAAADSEGGTTNNVNALLMGELQSTKVLGGGTLSLTDAYTQIVNKVGVQVQSVTAATTAADNLVTQRLTAQQAVSGVSLEEEQVALLQYAEQYQAASQLISVASELFDTLLGIAS
ncbi:MAG: flagellar hook-associated protein FlgK [Comamonas sp.]